LLEEFLVESCCSGWNWKKNWNLEDELEVAYKDSGLDMMKPIMCAEISDLAQALCKSSPAILGIDCIV
jgi:hypothetical protein